MTLPCYVVCSWILCAFLLECECYDHADSCHYNKTLDHGICEDCNDNTTGMFCERCLDKFYRNMSKSLYDPEVCLREYFCIEVCETIISECLSHDATGGKMTQLLRFSFKNDVL